MAEKLLKWLLRLTGIACLFALPFVFVPRAWMASIHQWAGLGTMPDGVIVSYLSRSTSAFYAMFGGLVLFLSTDVRKYSTLISYVAWLGIAYGLIMATHNAVMGMPIDWVLGEGCTAVPVAIIILLLQRAARRAGGKEA